MEPITKIDLDLINELSSRKYTENKLASNTSNDEQNHFKAVKSKLKIIANYFSNKYQTAYGPFEVTISKGNPITYAGTLNHVWGALFKGASNKQYAAQIGFVMDRKEKCLNVGFYFGRASRHGLDPQEKANAEKQLNNLGISLSNSLLNNSLLNSRYNDLFDFGFKAYSNGQPVTPIEWVNNIRTKTGNSQIIAKIYSNDFDIIENSTIDSFISQIIFLMVAINNVGMPSRPIMVTPLTPEQRAKKAERLAQIGLKGELFVMRYEQNKLIAFGIVQQNYPKHVALESDHFGYDVLSIDENRNEIFIEVKTTTRPNNDPYSRKFFISNNEFNVFSKNKPKYHLYRVYDIENSPALEILELDSLTKKADGYIFEY